jgi:hypothetical protein
LHHAGAGQKRGGKAEALAPPTLADFHPNDAEPMTQNTSLTRKSFG